jgi:hypothetical protein
LRKVWPSTSAGKNVDDEADLLKSFLEPGVAAGPLTDIQPQQLSGHQRQCRQS